MSRPSLGSLTQLARRPSVMLTVGIGLAGVSGSAFLALINASFPRTPGSGGGPVVALSAMNFLLATICTGMMAGSEQEMARAVSRSIAVGEDPAATERRQYRHAGWLGLGTLFTVAALSPALVATSLQHNWVLLAELLVGLVGGLALYPIRGALTGRRDYAVFSTTLIIEGLTRLIPAVIILALGAGSVWSYGLVFALGGPTVACFYGLYAPRRLRGRRERARAQLPEPVPVVESTEASATAATDPAGSDAETAGGAHGRSGTGVWILTAATLANQLLFNAVPLLLAAKYSNTGDKALSQEVAAVLSAVGLTRLGILMMVQLQAPLLPKLTAAAAHRRFGEVRRYTLVLSGLCAAVGLAGCLGCWLLGPWVLWNIMRALAHLPGDYLAALALGTAFVMVSYILQAALVAMDRHAVVLVAWAVGAIVTVPIFFTGEGLLRTTAIANAVGPFVAMLIMAVDAWLRTRGGDREESADGASVAASAPALQ
jgi:O-antigen/teichoic acid export membrane protein